MINISPNTFLLLKQNPASTACITSNKVYTYEELKQKVLTVARLLSDKGIEPSDRIGILSQNNIESVVSILSLWQISAIPVPINVRLTDSEIDLQLNEAGCKVILVQDSLVDRINSKDLEVIKIPIEITTDNTLSGRKELNLDEPAVIIFTSGSEIKSKGIVLSYNSLFNSAVNSNHLLRYTHSDRWMASLPFYHIGGFSIITRSLVFGIPLIITDSLSIDEISNSLTKTCPTFISLVSTQLKQLIDSGTKPNPELKNCLLGGGFSDSTLIKNAIDLGWPINKVYGSTESASFVTALLTEEFLVKPNSVGRSLPANNILIRGEDNEELKPFEIGEILIQSNAIMSGYLDKEKNKSVLKDGYYHSGDIGYLDEDNYLFVEGRKNYLISSGGENVNPAEVEQVLRLHPVITEAAVFPIEDEEWGEIVVAAIVMKKDSSEISFDEIKSFLEKKMAGFKIPKKIFFERSLPKSELGKVEKDKLIKRYTL